MVYLQSAKVHVSPLVVSEGMAILTAVAAVCRSIVSKYSGTQTGVPFGTDTKSLVANAGNIVNLAIAILSKKSVPVQPSDITAAVRNAVVRASGADAGAAATEIVNQIGINEIAAQAAAPVSPPVSSIPLASPPPDITGAFNLVDGKLVPLTPVLEGDTPAPAPVSV